MNRLLLPLLILFAVSSATVSDAGLFKRKSKESSTMERIKRQFDSISALLEKADQKRESGNDEEARRLYGATIAAYQDFHRKFPDANTEIIKFRIAYCRNQIIKLLEDKNSKSVNQSEQSNEKLPDDYTAIMAENTKLCRQGHYESVLKNMRDFVSRHPGDAHAQLLLATAQAGTGDSTGAMDSLRKSIKLNPAGSEAHYNLCQLLIRADNPDFNAARAHYKKAIELGAAPDSDLKLVLGL